MRKGQLSDVGAPRRVGHYRLMRFTTATTAATTPRQMTVISTQGVVDSCRASIGPYWNVTLTASVKLVMPGPSLYHAWKCHVSPDDGLKAPVGRVTCVMVGPLNMLSVM